MLEELWTCLGVEPEVVEMMVEHHIIFTDGVLWIGADKATVDVYVWNQLCSMLTAIWKFNKCSDSRYLTMGCSCRTVIAGFLTGISSLQRYSRQVKKCSEYYIHGFARMTPEVVAVAMLAAVASAPL